MAAKMLRLKAKRFRASPLVEAWRKLTRQRQVPIAGFRLAVDDAVMNARVRSQVYRGVYEMSKFVVADALMRPGDRVLELGAGLGLVTVLAASRCGGDAVISFEAVPRNAELIRRNLALNGVTADVRARAIGKADGTIDFFVADDAISSSTSTTRGETGMARIAVPCDDIRTVMAEVRPSVLLIDVEGTETDIVPLIDLSGVRAVMIQVHGDVVDDAAASTIMRAFLEAGLDHLHMCSIGNIWAFERPDKA
ncbi:Methyltransferase, FkbM family protein [Polymorphum gilvum SL003B-26A1]|uniref:Methyltransferase, FkbM family protein n=1 Tax=Polymorphum gilvum (strain LMG 25793 / CGMCC 1.9160 / SL003B-26A1) TaxID=991905 RepID=F2IVG7_POLGS|nr:Methyltransferase, FkbM family protein [Polymorphum gilvum SL003B-26A1]